MANIIEQWINYLYNLFISAIISLFIFFGVVVALLGYFVNSNKNNDGPKQRKQSTSVNAIAKPKVSSESKPSAPEPALIEPTISGIKAKDDINDVADNNEYENKKDNDERSIEIGIQKKDSSIRGILQKNSGIRLRKHNSSASVAPGTSANAIAAAAATSSNSTNSPLKSKRIQFFVEDNQDKLGDNTTTANSNANNRDDNPVDPVNSTVNDPAIDPTGDDKIRLLTSTRGHSDAITAVAFSPDGWFLATSGGMKDRCVKVWTRNSLIQVDKDGLRKPCTTPPRFTTIKLDSLDGPDCASSLSFPVGHATIIVVATQERREIKGWKISKTPGALAKLEFAFKTTHAYVMNCADLYMGKALHFDDPSMFVITSSKGDTDVRVWSLKGDKIHAIETNESVENVWVSPSGDRVAVANQGSIKIMDIQYRSGDASVLSSIKPTSIAIDSPTHARDITFEISFDAYKIEKTATGNCSIVAGNSGKSWTMKTLAKGASSDEIVASGSGNSDGSYSYLTVSPARPIVLGVSDDKVDVFYASKRSGTGSIFATATNETGRKIKLIKISPDGDCFITVDEDAREFLIYSLPKRGLV